MWAKDKPLLTSVVNCTQRLYAKTVGVSYLKNQIEIRDSLNIVDGNLTAEKYQQVLADYVVPSKPPLSTEFGEFVYQWYGASCHRAKSTSEKNKISAFATRDDLVSHENKLSKLCVPRRTIWS